MLNEDQARKALLRDYPGSKIEKIRDAGDRFCAILRIGDDEETGYDSFYKVDKRTGKTRDFTVLENLNFYSQLFAD